MLRQNKETFVESMRDSLNKAAGVLFVDFTGLTVAEVNTYRGKLREQDISYVVVKNTLMARALSGQSFESATACLKGTPTGVVIGYEDPVAAAKITYDFLKDCEHLKVKGGVVDGKPLSEQEAEALSKLPSKAEVQGSIIALAMSPGANLIAQVASPAGNIVGAIDALIEKLDR